MVVGAAVLAACGWLATATPLRLMGTTTTDFDVCQDPITSDPCEAESFTPVNQPQTRLAGVAEPTETASRLIADVQLDDGSPLELEVVGFGREPTGVVIFVHP